MPNLPHFPFLHSLLSLFITLALGIGCLSFGWSQQPSPTELLTLPASLFPSSYRIANDSNLFDPALRPFYHGVASGDPLADAVIIWTRVTPDQPEDSLVEVTWRVALDTGMQAIVRQGTYTTGPERDYTVKIDVTGLEAATTYFYEFEALQQYSLRGRTRTAPTGSIAPLHFGVVSCSNYEAGYFNAYGRLAERPDLQAIIHLGDYIYEYASGIYGDTSSLRRHDTLEAYSLEIYRARYGLYRLDPDLRKAHQQHPWIVIWDDHETANDAWTDGAQNHTEGIEGNWQQRKADAKQAYFEWLPIRANTDGTIYRRFSYGDLMDLIMVDTRLEGRDSQILVVDDPRLVDPARTMLGTEQKQWLFDQLSQSQARWKVIGNQVMFATFNIGWGSIASPGSSFDEVEGLFQDIWDGYPQERLEILQFVDSAAIHDVVVLSGDFHSSFAYDVPDTPNIAAATNRYQAVDNYDRNTGEGSILVEFVTPSVTSANFDEILSPASASILEGQINSTLIIPPFRNPNPHMKYADLDQHGYILLHLTEDSAQAEWMYVDEIAQSNSAQQFGAARYTLQGEDHLRSSNTPTPVDIDAPSLAPAVPRTFRPADVSPGSPLLIHHLFPNPAQDWVVVQYGLSQPTNLQVQVLDLQGKALAINRLGKQGAGMYDLRLDVSALVSGTYLLVLEGAGSQWQYKLQVRR